MNGINYSSILSNTGLFSNQKANKDEVKLKGALTGLNNVQEKKEDAKKQSNVDRDTYEYSGQARDVKAGYERPKRVESSGEENKYKSIDANGIQEGVKISDAAYDLLKELREKYGNMDIVVAEWSTDEEQDYYASKATKDYSVLINPELLEKMAADESVRAQYESVLSGAGEKFDTLKEELGDDIDKIESFSITIDKDGKVSYAVQLLKDMAESNNAQKKEIAEQKQQEKIEEKRAERKEAEKDRQKKATEKIEADSIEELIAAIKEKLYPEKTEQINVSENLNDVSQVQTVVE